MKKYSSFDSQRRRSIGFGLSSTGIVALGGGIGQVFAQSYPNGPVSIILPLQVGSASDIAVRAVAERLATRLNVPFIVENVAAAAGLVGLEKLSRVKSDGQTIAALNNSIVTILPHLQAQNIKVDTQKDFVPIVGIANIPTFFAVSKKSSIRTIKDLTLKAKQSPDGISYASGGVGSPQHLATEMYKAYSGTQLLHVPYRGASQAALAVAAGEVELMSMALPLAQPYLPDGKVRLIGYCGTERHPQFRDIPTLQEQGVAKYDYSSWVGLFVPKDTPANFVKLLRQEAEVIVNDRAFHVQMIRAGMDPWPRTASELVKISADDFLKWQKVIASANIKSG
jgi:tripartite-type tricarboxylate transporter receptor subunit TctC